MPMPVDKWLKEIEALAAKVERFAAILWKRDPSIAIDKRESELDRRIPGLIAQITNLHAELPPPDRFNWDTFKHGDNLLKYADHKLIGDERNFDEWKAFFIDYEPDQAEDDDAADDISMDHPNDEDDDFGPPAGILNDEMWESLVAVNPDLEELDTSIGDEVREALWNLWSKSNEAFLSQAEPDSDND